MTFIKSTKRFEIRHLRVMQLTGHQDFSFNREDQDFSFNREFDNESYQALRYMEITALIQNVNLGSH